MQAGHHKAPFIKSHLKPRFII